MGGTQRTAVTVAGWEVGAGSLEKTSRAVACAHAQQGGAAQRARKVQGTRSPVSLSLSNAMEGAPTP